MPPPRTVLTTPSIERSSPPGTDAGAYGRLPPSPVNELPLALCFPRDDHGFAERVQILFDGSYAERPFAVAIQVLLRETYPLAVISPRHELASLDRELVWYAFRDGSAVPNVDRETS